MHFNVVTLITLFVDAFKEKLWHRKKEDHTNY